jgi:hypothetical protein
MATYKIIGADGKEYGPVPAEVLRQWAAEGRANGQTKVLPEGGAEWRSLAELPEFAVALGGVAAPALTPGHMGAPATARTNPLALAGLILGALALLAGCCCYGVPFNLAGIICSGLALAQINRDPQQQGRGLAVAGLVLSILSIVLAAVMLLFLPAFHGSEFLRRIQRL